jgi:hypothetical protein
MNMNDKRWEYHSLEQLVFLKQMSTRTELEPREALFLATQLVNHGSPFAHEFLFQLQKTIQARSAQDYLSRLVKRDNVIQRLPALKSLRNDPDAYRNLYETDGYLFRPGSSRRDIAVVIFTTIYNNYSVANTVMDSFLSELGVSRLFLRDASGFRYFRGVTGLTNNLAGLSEALHQVLHQHGVRSAILTGYSSGGYPSLYVATEMKNVDYIGYSVCTDISAGTSLPQHDAFRPERDDVDASLLSNLRDKIDSNSPSRYIVHYGHRSYGDRVHAENLLDLNCVELVCHHSVGHEVPVHLIEEEKFMNSFVSHIDRAS